MVGRVPRLVGSVLVVGVSRRSCGRRRNCPFRTRRADRRKHARGKYQSENERGDPAQSHFRNISSARAYLTHRGEIQPGVRDAAR